MKGFNRLIWPTSLLMISMILVACGSESASDAGHADDHLADSGDQPPKNPNLIDIPSAVRTNLGIRFVQVERRHVEKTLRVPGRFERDPYRRQKFAEFSAFIFSPSLNFS